MACSRAVASRASAALMGLRADAAATYQVRLHSTPAEGGSSDDKVPEGSSADKRQWLGEVVRGSQASELAALGFYMGQRRVSKGIRPDLDYFVDTERGNIGAVDNLATTHRSRPSALRPILCAAGYAIGVGSALAGETVTRAAAGAIRDVAEEHYNDALRHMMEEGTYYKDQDKALKEALKTLRDESRAPEGSPRAPGVEALASPKDLTPIDAIGAVVRAVTEGMVRAARRI